MKQQQKQPEITIFFSYAQPDQVLQERLAIHLSQLKRDGMIKEWSDQQIPVGSDRSQAIDQAMRSAHIVLLLISADFLASDACYHVEMQQALERHRRGETRVVPVIIRPCDWQHSPFAHLQCLPRNTKPATTWNNQDEAFVVIAHELRRIITQQQLPIPSLSNIQQQNRTRLLKRVRAIWIKGLLERSLYQAAWIDLHLQEQPNALENPWRFQVQELDQAPYTLPPGTNVVEVYDEADGELLLLGEPGSGKTTLLLQLARTLLNRAEADECLPVPVVFNLSSWAQKRELLTTWFVEELENKYQISRKIGEHWIETQKILPLLDGLDEVADSARMACVHSIIAYHRQHLIQGSTPLVICCRSEEYQALNIYLPLQRAISILPLSDEQVNTYLSQGKGQLEGLKHLLHADTDFAVLVHKPLILSIAVLAFQEKHLVYFPSEDNFSGTSEEHLLQILFSTYVECMLIRRGQLHPWKREQFLRWLTFIATRLYQHKQTIFSVEDLQLNWLPYKQQRLYQWNVAFLVRLFGGLFVSYWVIMMWGRNVERGWPFLGILGFILGFVLFGKYVKKCTDKMKIAEVITCSWTWIRVRHLIIVGISLICGLCSWLISGKFVVFETFSYLVMLLGQKMIAMDWLSTKQLTDRKLLSPNEGIQRSGKNGLFLGLIFGLFLGPIQELFNHSYPGLVFMLSSGLLGWLFYGLSNGLGAFVQHFVFRFLLRCTNCLPLNLVPFLDEAAERLLLHRVGGSYIFVHQLLLEYFAKLDQSASIENTFLKRKRGKE